MDNWTYAVSPCSNVLHREFSNMGYGRLHINFVPSQLTFRAVLRLYRPEMF